MQCPFCFALDAGDGVDGVEKKGLVGLIFFQCVNGQAVCFAVYVFNSNLNP